MEMGSACNYCPRATKLATYIGYVHSIPGLHFGKPLHCQPRCRSRSALN